MVKKLICGVLAGALVALALFFLWPMSFGDVVSEEKELSVVYMDTDMRDIRRYQFQPDSEEFEQIVQVLEGYSFHRSFRTVLSGSGMEGNDAGYWLHLYSGTDGGIDCGGTGEVMVDNRVYRMGYFGNGAALDMMEEILAVLDGE